MASVQVGLLHPSEPSRPASGGTPRRTGWWWPRVRRLPSFWVGVCGVVLLVAGAIGAPILASSDPTHAYRPEGLTDAGDPVGPNQRFVLGTDLLGRDYLSRLLHGARVSLVIGVGASLLASILGVAVGVTASIAGTPSAAVRVPLTGKRVSVPLPVEGTLMRLTDAALAFPILLLALALTAVAGSNVLVTLGIVTAVLWTYPARIVYARVSVIKELPFIEAARAIGIHPARLVVRHVLPHIASVVIAYAALAISAAILFEATLSYLGVGIPPPSPSWGSMIADHFSYYASDPRLLYLPGGAVMLTVLSFNLIGDALRDALDPFAAR